MSGVRIRLTIDLEQPIKVTQRVLVFTEEGFETNMAPADLRETLRLLGLHFGAVIEAMDVADARAVPPESKP